jgi:transcriptional regulator with XRE-family HTH domain
MDWKNIIHELQESGMTQQEIADACNTGQSHISSLANGKRHEPRYSLGDRLRQRCKAGAAERRSGGDRRKADRRAEAA